VKVITQKDEIKEQTSNYKLRSVLDEV